MFLYERSTYRAPYDWLISKRIQEWDLRQANISVLRSLDIITEEQYNTYASLPKEKREKQLGILRKNKVIEEKYQQGLALAKRLFFEKNNINEENVLYIDHDSITTVHEWNDISANSINGKLSPYLEFRLKNIYTSFYKMYTFDFLYYNTSSSEVFRFKGIDDYKLRLIHKDYFIDLLLSIAYSAQNDKITDTIEMLTNIYNMYCNRQMDINYYREFTTDGKFKLFSTPYNTYYTDIVDERYRPLIDISYNASILRLLYKVFMTEYFRQN